VLLEPARRAEMAPLMAAAYGLSDSERRVTELVAQGLSTRQVAHRLHVSAYTVQDDLVATLFFDHYATSLTSGDHRPAPP
jgi:DNA-binding NarL/FixJ family response regulator